MGQVTQEKKAAAAVQPEGKVVQLEEDTAPLEARTTAPEEKAAQLGEMEVLPGERVAQLEAETVPLEVRKVRPEVRKVRPEMREILLRKRIGLQAPMPQW